MKHFLSTFLGIAVLLVVFLVFGGAVLMQNFLGLIAVISFGLAVLVSWLMRLESELETLKKKVEQLEQQ